MKITFSILGVLVVLICSSCATAPNQADYVADNRLGLDEAESEDENTMEAQRLIEAQQERLQQDQRRSLERQITDPQAAL